MLTSIMLLSTLQAFFLICSNTVSPVQTASLPEQPAKETEVLLAGQPDAQLTAEGVAEQSAPKQTAEVVAEPTTNGTKKPMGDPLAMMPESLTDAGEKARLWLNQDNQMVTAECLCQMNSDPIKCNCDFL